MDTVIVPLELKFAGSPDAGEFEGYGAVFGNIDQHGDRILPGAFTATLAERKAAGGTVPMHVNHGLPQLGGQRAVGVWTDLAEDGKGLRAKGRISGMNTDAGRNLFERVKDGAFPGLSIGYRVAPGGAIYGTKAGEPRRSLKAINLGEISLVDTPSNGLALVDAVKTALAQPDAAAAAASIAAAMRLHDKHMGADPYGSPTLKERAQVMNHLRDGFEALTGSRAPEDLDAWKVAPTLRDVEALLREECGLSHKQARSIAARRFTAAPRVEGMATPEDTAALWALLSGFKLPQLSRDRS
ncbi:HK97 family phage prohead protease [Methylobacterium fujisawaense]|uniref:HK97 family phage prohead protease n=1 Tax=Methylobacterium fujisawaense TaxID=107400 RepID=UPI003CF8E1A7